LRLSSLRLPLHDRTCATGRYVLRLVCTGYRRAGRAFALWYCSLCSKDARRYSFPFLQLTDDVLCGSRRLLWHVGCAFNAVPRLLCARPTVLLCRLVLCFWLLVLLLSLPSLHSADGFALPPLAPLAGRSVRLHRLEVEFNWFCFGFFATAPCL